MENRGKFEATNLDHCSICRFTPLEMDFKQPDLLSLSSSPPQKKGKRVILHMDEASPRDGWKTLGDPER